MFRLEPRLRHHPILAPQAIDGESEKLPPPPTDLPRPWRGVVWRRWFTVGFFVTLFILWFLGRQLHIRFMALETFGGACISAGGIFLFSGLYLLNRFQSRGYHENYSARANRPLNQAIRRYKRPRASEALYQLFPRYVIGDNIYYLVWYVPNVSTAIAASLGPGAEPLLFDGHGNWLDDEPLFHKALMMWSCGIEFSPKSLQSRLVTDFNGLQAHFIKYLSPLPRLLEMNAEAFQKRGLKQEFDLVLEGYPAKLAQYRYALDFMRKNIDWAEAHGWDSLTELHYDDMLQYHEQRVRMVESQRQFAEKHRMPEFEAAAMKLRNVVAQRREVLGGWRRRMAVDHGLQALAVPLPVAQDHFRLEDGSVGGPRADVGSLSVSRCLCARG
jgi:hypothetical protein